MQRGVWLKVALSLFVIYHLLAVLILPNPHSIVGRRMAPYLTPYANFFQLNTTWRFFAPDPTPNVFYEYEVIRRDWLDNEWDESEDWEDFAKPIRWPPDDYKGFFTENYNRLVYHSRFVTLTEQRTGQFLVPFLCRRHPEAGGISVQSVTEKVPSIDRAHLDRGSFEDLTRSFHSQALRFDCPEEAKP